MTKDELISLVALNLGDIGKIHDNQIHLNVALAWREMLKYLYQNNPPGLDRFAYQYQLAVQHEEASGRYYSDLPVTPIRFKDGAEGVRRIKKLKQRDNITKDDILFVPMPASYPELLANVDAGSIMTEIGYILYGPKKLYYSNFNPDIISVTAEIVPIFEEIDFDDEIDMPPGGEQVLLGLMGEFLKGTPYIDPKLRRTNNQEI